MRLNEIVEVKAGDLERVKNYKSGNLNISHKNLVFLEGCPKEVTGAFICTDNELTSLEGCPTKIDGWFDCSFNKLTSVKGCPEKINGWFDCSNNQLSYFEYFPKHIQNVCNISRNLFTSFKDIDQHIHTIDGKGVLNAVNASYVNITSGFSDMFGIDGLQRIEISNLKVQNIVNKYLPEKDLINFQDEMIKAGYESYL